jgi:hypothetical protein
MSAISSIARTFLEKEAGSEGVAFQVARNSTGNSTLACPSKT